jgi:nucleoside-triphosphatase
VEDVLGSDRNMLVVLHEKSNHPLARKIRKEFEVFTVTPQNREMIVSTIVQKITKELQ